VGRDGLILADLGRHVGVLTQDIDLGKGRRTLFFFNTVYDRTDAVIASRRPELYHMLVDPVPKDLARRRLQSRAKGVRHV
jgi:hypothetical protein